MKQLLVSILTLIIIVSCGNVKSNSKNPDDLVPSEETIFEKIFGDLNNDGEDDCVIITKQTKKSAFETDEIRGELDLNRRGIVIAFKEGDYYNTVLTIPDCFSSENEDGGVYFAPELSVEIKRGNIYYQSKQVLLAFSKDLVPDLS